MRIKPLSISFAVLFLITSLYLTYTAVSVEQIKYPAGFGTIKWGTELRSLDNMEFVKSGKTSKGEIKIYRNTAEIMNYAGIALSNIEYGFNNDRLYFVALKTEGLKNWEELKKQAIKDYGTDFSKIDNSDYKNYVWQGEQSYIALEYKSKDDSSVLLLISN